MNVTNKTTRTFTISEITEAQALDLVELSIALGEVPPTFTQSIHETLNNLRQALLSVGLKRGDTNAD